MFTCNFLKSWRVLLLSFLITTNSFSLCAQVFNGNATITKKITSNGSSSNGLSGITSGVGATPGVRGWFYFNISSIPQGSVITSAVLNYPTAAGTQNSNSQANQLNALSFNPQTLSGTALYNALVNGAPNVSNLFTGRWNGTHPLALNTNGPSGGNAATATNLINHIQARVNVGFNFLAFSLVRGSNNTYNFQTPSLTINYTPPPPCVNPPNAGNTVINPSFACPSVLRTLSLTGATFGTGQTYQWQSSPDNVTWANIAGATLSQYQANITTPAYYRCRVVCGGSSSISSSAQATVDNYLTCYCSTSYPNGCNSGDQISNVVIAGTTLSNSSSCSAGSYTFYNTPVHSLTKTVAYSLSVTMGGDILGQFAAAWMDFDQSGSFEVSELIGNQTTSVGPNGTAVFNFTIPSTALNGQTRLRIRGGDDGPIGDDESCGNTSNAWGETEDYLIDILTPGQCTDPPTAGTISGPDSVCTGTNFQLLASGFSQGTTLQWQSSINSGGPFTDIAGATSAVLSINNYTTSLFFKLKVSCTLDAFTSEKAVTIKLPINCLCPALYNDDCTLNDEIKNVTLGVLNNTSGCSPNSYTFYNNLNIPDLAKSISYTLSVSMGSDPFQFVGAWVDYNKNSIFESTEFIGGNSVNAGANGIVNITFSPPSGALTGVTALRIRGGHDVVVASTEGCGLAFSDFGETEDYLVNILPPPVCIDPPVAGIISGNLSICSGETTTLTLSGNSNNTTIQWQESSDGINFTDIAGATTLVYTTTPLTSGSYFQVVVTCINSSATVPVNVTIKSFVDCYCINNLNITSCGNGHITKVEILTTTLNNSTTCSQQPPSGAYSAFAAIGSTTAVLQRNVFYALNVETNGVLGVNTSVWIDLNQNGVFDATEWTQIYINQTSGTIPVFIPSTATLGQTGMRIRSVLSGTTLTGNDACTSLSSGETEDYIITIDPAPVCVDPPVAGSISGNLLVCAGSNVLLSLSNYTLGASLQWQSSTDNVLWTNVAGANTPFLSQVTISVPTYFRAVVTCTNSNTTSSVQVNIKPFYECYCFDDLNPLGCGNGDIVNVQIASTSLNNTSTCNFSLPPGAYSSFPPVGNTTASLQQGTPYNLSLSIDPVSTPANASVWIDFNRNGAFEASEWHQVFANGLNGTVSITVPVNAGIGLTGMRVRSRNASDSNGANDACQRFTSGETEDYLITITPSNQCTDPPVAGTISGNLNVCNGSTTQLSLTGFTPGTTLQWQTSPDGLSWINVVGATNNTLTTSAIISQTYFRVEVTCSTSVFSNTVIANVVTCFNMQTGSVTTCSGIFYDDGGDLSNYSNNLNLTYTIIPTTGNLLEVNFASFDLENGFDFLKIYNGNSTAAPIIGPLNGFTGSNNPGIITSGAIDGSLTFEFLSNSTNNLSGWQAALNCVANVCSGTPVAGTILQPTLNCINNASSLTLSGASSGAGISYQWQESDDDGVVDPYTNIGGANAVTYNTPPVLLAKYYRVVVVCSNSALSSVTPSYQIQLKPSPQIIITSNSPVCDGNSINIASFNIATGQSTGNTFSWAGPNGFSSSINNPNVSNASVLNAGYYVLTLTNQFSCTSIDSTLIEVKSNPILFEVIHTDVSCYQGNDGLIDVDATAGEAPYLFNDGSNFNLDGIFSGLQAGNLLISVDDVNGCVGTINVFISEPPPVTVANAGADQTICENDATLSANSPLVGVGMWSFVSGGGIISNPSNPQTTVTNLQSGSNILRWTIKYSSCPDSSYDEVEINAGAIPTATISGDKDICIGASAPIRIDFTGTPPWNYSYTDGVNTFGPFATSNPTTIFSVTPTVSTSYGLVSVVADNCIGSISGLASVTVSIAPPANQTSSLNGIPVYGCPGTSVALNCASVAGATSYTWDAPNASFFDGNPLNTSPYVVNSNTVQLTFGQPNGSGYLICVSPTNGCGSAIQRCAWVRGITSVPAAVTGAIVACENTTQTYSTLPIIGATGYTWSGSNGISITSGNGTQNVTASFAPGFTQGTVCVSSNTTCYLSPPKCLTVKNSVAQLPAINGPQGICPGPTPYFYNINPVAGIASYTWNLPVATNGSSVSNNIGVTFNNNFSSGNICVKGTSICGVQSAQRCFTIVTGVPPTPSAIIGASTALCGQTVVYTSAAVQGAIGYTWTIPPTASLNSGQGTNSIEVSYNSSSLITGQICVAVNSNCPGTSQPRCISIKGAPNNPGAITASPVVICSEQEGVQFSVPATTGNFVLNWNVTNGSSIVFGQGTNNISVDFGTTGGIVIATASNACGSASSTYPVNFGCREEDDDPPSIEAMINQSIEVYPNPSNGKFYLGSFNNSLQNIEVIITDVAGRLVTCKKVDQILIGESLEIDLNNNPSGVYFIKLRAEHMVLDGRVIIKD